MIDWHEMQSRNPALRAPGTSAGTSRAILSNRISHFFNIKGSRSVGSERPNGTPLEAFADMTARHIAGQWTRPVPVGSWGLTLLVNISVLESLMAP